MFIPQFLISTTIIHFMVLKIIFLFCISFITTFCSFLWCESICYSFLCFMFSPKPYFQMIYFAIFIKAILTYVLQNMEIIKLNSRSRDAAESSIRNYLDQAKHSTRNRLLKTKSKPSWLSSNILKYVRGAKRPDSWIKFIEHPQ